MIDSTFPIITLEGSIRLFLKRTASPLGDIKSDSSYLDTAEDCCLNNSSSDADIEKAEDWIISKDNTKELANVFKTIEPPKQKIILT